MTDTLADEIERLDGPKVLRFSECVVAGRHGYQWASAKTDNLAIMRFLLWCWNNRADILPLLRTKAQSK